MYELQTVTQALHYYTVITNIDRPKSLGRMEVGIEAEGCHIHGAGNLKPHIGNDVGAHRQI